MSADFTPEKEDYKILTPFKMQVLTNFPYIEADFDALTNYQLLCKVVEYLNNVIANENEVTEQVTSLYNAYVSLQNYVNESYQEFTEDITADFNNLHDYVYNYFDNLNVQEEINHKLDEMTTDGTLTNLIKNYVDPIYSAYENEIDGEISDIKSDVISFKSNVNTRLTAMSNEIQSVSSGSPLVASSTSGMTDTTRVYVNTTDGKWYYYDGDSWEIGGTYQATEDSTTLTEIKDNLEALDYYTSTKTMFDDLEDITTLTAGILNTSGEVVSTGAWYTTDYFDTKDIVKLTAYVIGNTNNLSIAYYDEYKNFISGEAVSVSSVLETIVATIPEDARYLRISLLNYGGDSSNQYLQFETSGFQEDRYNIEVLQTYDENLQSVKAYNENKILLSSLKTIWPGIIDTTGEEHWTDQYNTTEYITTENLTSLSIYTIFYTTFNSVSFYDKDKNYISGVCGESDGVTEYVDLTIPENAAYFRVSIPVSNSGLYIVEESSNILLNTNTLFNKENTMVSSLSIQGYIDTDGVFRSSSGWLTTDFIPTYDIYHLEGKFYEYTTICYASFYDEFKQYIADSGLIGKTNGDIYTEAIDIPKNAKYVRLCFGASDNTQYYEIIYDAIKHDILKKENAKNPLYGKKLLAVGDSITAGSSENISYVDLIAYKNNMDFTNSGVWGATLASNVTGSSGAINELISTMDNDADYIILSGGVNDYYYVNGGVEPEGSITTGTYGAYTENYDEDTFCGALESICSQAITKWPGKKILYVATHRVLDTNVPNENTHAEMIRTILKKWGIPYVDLYQEMPSLFLTALKSTYTRNGDGLHPTTEGYKLYYVPPVENKLKEL